MYDPLLSKDFRQSEFACKCPCGISNISIELVKALQSLRDLLKEPIKINSACRCPAHNKAVRGSEKSFHITTPEQEGKAVDIQITNKGVAYKVREYAVQCGFKGIGVGANFIHLDVRPGNILYTFFYT